MFTFPNYHCFELKEDNKLVAISSVCITIRFYSGKQLEVDNVVVDANHKSGGLGKILFENIEEWAKTDSFQTIELKLMCKMQPLINFILI